MYLSNVKLNFKHNYLFLSDFQLTEHNSSLNHSLLLSAYYPKW